MQRSLFVKTMQTVRISLHRGAEKVGFSPNHFSTVFSQETGQTFVEYLTAVRIEAAKHLLTKRQQPQERYCV